MHFPAWPHPFYETYYRHPAYQLGPCVHHQPVQYVPYVRPDFPDVNPNFFHESAGAFRQLLNDAAIILNKLADSREFAYKVMDAAQKNELDKVEELIRSTGIKGDIEVNYNPDGINLKMGSKIEDTECCKLDMAIRWR
ncbi:hypothetical protein [Virgibacillus oceani]|uniref:Uncharacterized protein n=1 Tax=Virgibacillus oceani TaxID=1479511 RepID=A0A917HF48_9BACI|nr:hypothetical protein [Virgibacillus oceani]GGG77199.1 hypothetical protein GCM10011398_22820 [Virgibacillus oceani]